MASDDVVIAVRRDMPVARKIGCGGEEGFAVVVGGHPFLRDHVLQTVSDR